MEGFSSRLRDEVDLRALTIDVDAVVRERCIRRTIRSLILAHNRFLPGP